jgi:SAM-dependent methyltransferase
MELILRTPGGAEKKAALYAMSGIELREHSAIFDLEPGRHAYITTKPDLNFNAPLHKDLFALAPDTKYVLEVEIECSIPGGSCFVWFIAYNELGRTHHVKKELRSNRLRLSLRTAPDHHAVCFALRVTSAGHIASIKIEVQKDHKVSAIHVPGPSDWAQFSVFFDPMDSWPFEERHHKYYEDFTSSIYDDQARSFSEMSGVLDVGCGPGLLLEALLKSGVDNILGLERDPVYLKSCRDRGLPVVEHDLTRPFPFIDSCSFDGAVAHQSLDYLSPFAGRLTLREIYRCLKPGGRFIIMNPTVGRARGDMCRTVSLTLHRLHSMLEEQGFEIEQEITSGDQLNIRNRKFEVHARKPHVIGQWGYSPKLFGTDIYAVPWTSPHTILEPGSSHWDNVSCRDFTLLTDPAKNEIRINGELVGYFTGYREQEGHIERALCRAVSADGITWHRSPNTPVFCSSDGDWDIDGIAAGSVLYLEGEKHPYRLYYCARADNEWPGIGYAESADGILWERWEEPLLTKGQFDGFMSLKILALADVIQSSTGVWLLFAEGYRKSGDGSPGFIVCQAVSHDGINWQPRLKPVLTGSDFSFLGRHAANPKCVEVEPGRFIMGLNAAGNGYGFDLYLAVSSDGENWLPLQREPVVYRRPGDYRIESLFFSRNALLQEDRRIYYFLASSNDTARTSHIVTAQADPQTPWGLRGWEPVLKITNNVALIESGRSHRLILPLLGEEQITFAAQCDPDLRGTLKLSCGEHEILQLHGNGLVMLLDEQACPALPEGELSFCLRLIRPDSRQSGLELTVWHNRELIHNQYKPMLLEENKLDLYLKVDEQNSGTWGIKHFDFWVPDIRPAESPGDAHMYIGHCDTGNPLLPNITAQGFEAVLKDCDISRALVVPYGSGMDRDSFGQIATLAGQPGSPVFPLIRLGPIGITALRLDSDFLLKQCELFWQLGQMFGFMVQLALEELPPEKILRWAERRRLILLCHVASIEDLDLLEKEILEEYKIPLLLSHFGGYPTDMQRINRALQLAQKHPNLYLIASSVHLRNTLRKAITTFPYQVLFGSDFPAEDPRTRDRIETLDICSEYKTLVFSENLRFLTERCLAERRRMLQAGKELLFPPIPTTEDDLNSQGFRIVSPGNLKQTESEWAKEAWRTMNFDGYRKDKPWRNMIAEVVAGLGPASVLELGCNAGANLHVIRQYCKGIRVVGVDINGRAVEAGKSAWGLDLLVGDEQTLIDFDALEFDLSFTVSVLDHIPDVGKTIQALLHCTRRNIVLLEVWLPKEGRVEVHFDHQERSTKLSTIASYSWHLEERLRNHPRIHRIDSRFCYLHSGMLGPYYKLYTVWLRDKSDM